MKAYPDSFDNIWEKLRKENKHMNQYPYEFVIRFLLSHAPPKPRNEVNILEVGCGTGNNLWFAAREGFKVAGIDGSKTAIEYARTRFEKEKLEGDFRIGNFTSLPFSNDHFDLVIDRGALTSTTFTGMKQALSEIWRVLKRGGKFLFNPYSDRCSSSVSGNPTNDGTTTEITEGYLVGLGQITFLGRQEVNKLLEKKWKILSLEHIEIIDFTQPRFLIEAEWRVIAEKISQ